MSTVNIDNETALVIARAVGRMVSLPHNFRSSTADIVHEYVVDGLVALVSEGWQLIPPGATPDAENIRVDPALLERIDKCRGSLTREELVDAGIRLVLDRWTRVDL